MTNFSKFLIAIFLSALIFSSKSFSQSIPFDSARWTITGENSKVEDFLGRKSLYLPSGIAYLKDAAFEDGVIEVDIAAPANVTSFVGLVFRLEKEGDYEVVYFRPHKSKQIDAVQYTPSFNSSTAWQIYTGEGFTTAVEIPKEQWIHTRIEISGLQAKVFFNNAAEPTLIVEDLKRGYGKGSVGVWGFANGGHFSNFSYKIEKPNENRERKTVTIPAGIIQKWELSDAFDAAQKNPEILPPTAELKSMKWQTVEVEPPGMLVINRYRQSPDIVPSFRDPADRTGKREGRKAVFARAVIYSDKDQIKKMSLGYSDEITVFLNSQPVFTGRSAFHYRDPFFLGVMDVENDAVYLNLKKGRNELLLGVADYFGGWGFICRLDDPQGIKFE